MRAFGDRGADDWADEDWVGVGFDYILRQKNENPEVTNLGAFVLSRADGTRTRNLTLRQKVALSD